MAKLEDSAQVWVYDHLKHFINKLAFRIFPKGFESLEVAGNAWARCLCLIWDGRDWGERPVGTGAYIYKVHLNLVSQEGQADERVVKLLRVGAGKREIRIASDIVWDCLLLTPLGSHYAHTLEIR